MSLATLWLLVINLAGTALGQGKFIHRDACLRDISMWQVCLRAYQYNSNGKLHGDGTPYGEMAHT